MVNQRAGMRWENKKRGFGLERSGQGRSEGNKHEGTEEKRGVQEGKNEDEEEEV